MRIGNSKSKVVRYRDAKNVIYFGLIQDESIYQLKNTQETIFSEEFIKDGVVLDNTSDITILPPVNPGKIINFGWTYEEHALEAGGLPNLKEPLLFLKPNTALIANNEDIKLPPDSISSKVELEGELALVVGKKGRNIDEKDALDYIFGCTIINDVTARDLTLKDPQYTRGKGFDTFAPVGPYIVTNVDPSNLSIKTLLNETVVQQGNTSEMSLTIPYLISWISQIMTLEPGDILATGSPGGSCVIKPNDIIRIEIDQIGSLQNSVI